MLGPIIPKLTSTFNNVIIRSLLLANVSGFPAHRVLDCSLSLLVQALVLVPQPLVHLQHQGPGWELAAAAFQAWASCPGRPSGGDPAEAAPWSAFCKP